VVFLLSILAYFIWFAVGRDDSFSSTGTQQGSEQVKYNRTEQHSRPPEDFLYVIYFDVYKDGHLMFKT